MMNWIKTTKCPENELYLRHYYSLRWPLLTSAGHWAVWCCDLRRRHHCWTLVFWWRLSCMPYSTACWSCRCWPSLQQLHPASYTHKSTVTFSTSKGQSGSSCRNNELNVLRLRNHYSHFFSSVCACVHLHGEGEQWEYVLWESVSKCEWLSMWVWIVSLC